MKTSETLKAAKQLILDNGWGKGNFKSQESGSDEVCYCSVGAIAEVTGKLDRWKERIPLSDGSGLLVWVRLDMPHIGSEFFSAIKQLGAVLDLEHGFIANINDRNDAMVIVDKVTFWNDNRTSWGPEGERLALQKFDEAIAKAEAAEAMAI